nr:EscU/YscU/HrcU family type III secretion system export apparatus switch protein [Brevibacillus dissolubilis]
MSRSADQPQSSKQGQPPQKGQSSQQSSNAQPNQSSQPAQKPKSAVALRYQSGRADAPIVTAKGKGVVAENILQKAKENNVPIQEDPSLVEVLSKLDLDQQIPPELYQVVAEILAFVYRLDKKGFPR